jgi:hypothetical protein
VEAGEVQAEPLALPGLLIDALVVDSGRAQAHRPRPNRQATLARVPVAHHQPPAVPVALLDKRRDVLVDLDLKRRRDHPPRALTSQLVQRDRGLLGATPIDPANISHGVPSCRPIPPSVLINREGTPPSSSSPSTTSG